MIEQEDKPFTHADAVKLKEEIEAEAQKEIDDYARLDSEPLFRKLCQGYMELNQKHNELLLALDDKKYLKSRLRIIRNKR